MNEERMLKSALIGGVLIGILSSLPVIGLFNCVCCAWVIGGGLLAAYLYVKDSSIPVTLGRGAALGLLTGVIGAFVFALFSIPLYMVMKNRSGGGFVEQMRQQLDQLPNMPPESRQMLLDFLSRGNVGILVVVFGLVFVLVLYALFAMLGGTIGVAVFEKRKPGAPPTGASQYQPPINLPPPPPDTP